MTWLGFLIVGVVLLLLTIVLHPPWKEICAVIGGVMLVLALIALLAGGVLVGDGVDDDGHVGMAQHAIT